MPKLFHITLIVISLLLLTACPQHFKKTVDNIIPPDNYKPNYLTKQISLNSLKDSLARMNINTNQVLNEQKSVDSTLVEDNNSKSQNINLEIRSVNSDNYPDEIKLKVIVSDNNGKFITELAPPYLEKKIALEKYWTNLIDSCSGIENEITDFEIVEVRSKTAQKHAIAYLLDHSGSIGEHRARALQNSVKKMLASSRSGDMASVIRFTTEAIVEIPLTDNLKRAAGAMKVDGMDMISGGTKIYDAMDTTIKIVAKAPDSLKKTIILFTDGVDGGSKIPIDSIMLYAKHQNITVYTIALGMGMLQADPMRKIADYTGGRFYHIYSDKEFPYVFADIYLSLSNYYEITYKAPQCESYHSVKLKLDLSELGHIANADGFYDRSVVTKDDPIGHARFYNINFQTGKSDIAPDSYPILDNTYNSLISNPNLELKIIGHTDDIGDEKVNQTLSEKRAESVKNYLVSKGIDPKRLKTEGKGESEPLFENSNDEFRRRNRRIEFVILKR